MNFNNKSYFAWHAHDYDTTKPSLRQSLPLCQTLFLVDFSYRVATLWWLHCHLFHLYSFLSQWKMIIMMAKEKRDDDKGKRQKNVAAALLFS